MSPLDDARELTACLGRTDDGLCRQCGRRDDGQQEHREDCPMPRAEVFMPRIVAVLEAAERIAQKYGTVYVEDLGLDIEALVAAMQDEGR